MDKARTLERISATLSERIHTGAALSSRALTQSLELCFEALIDEMQPITKPLQADEVLTWATL